MSLCREVWRRENGLSPQCGNDDQHEPVHRCRLSPLYDHYWKCSELIGMARSRRQPTSGSPAALMQKLLICVTNGRAWWLGGRRF
jgi:hypothetical protein